VLGTKRIEARLGAEEILNSRLRRMLGGASAGWAFWSVLGVVVLGLLVVVAKLLPKKTE
jgi:hypothetical protein